jgi:acyl dehydratase
MIARTLAGRDLAVGQRGPVLERTWHLPDLVAYGGATWDWHRLHYDAAYAAARGLPGPVVDGQAFGAILAEALMDWLGPRAFIRKLGFRMSGMVFAGQTFRCESEVEAICEERERSVVTIAQRILVGDRLVIGPAHAEVVLPVEGGTR